MKRRTLFTAAAFAAAAGLATAGAALMTARIESSSTRDVAQALSEAGHDWARVDANGLRLAISGAAPDEAMRLRALARAGDVVDPSRIEDAMTIRADDVPADPDPGVEILRNGARVSLIGLVPGEAAHRSLSAEIDKIAGGPDQVSDLLQTADMAAPEVWPGAIEAALIALRAFEYAKISVELDRVAVSALGEDARDGADADQDRLAQKMRQSAPDGVEIDLDIAVPRPVITPFALQFTKDTSGARLEACSADGPRAADVILAAAGSVGLEGARDCALGLGQPSPDWGEAAALSIRAVGSLGAGTVTMSDANVTVAAGDRTDPKTFADEMARLEETLPAAFALRTVPPETTDGPSRPITFTGRIDETGNIRLSGPLADEQARRATQSFAEAAFGTDRLRLTTQVDRRVPDEWPMRVMAALKALSFLERGTLSVELDRIEISGITGVKNAESEISGILGAVPGASTDLSIDVTYDAQLDPAAGLPSPEECVDRINTVLKSRQIAFSPGAAVIEDGAGPVLDRIVKILDRCRTTAMEVGGHTDSQGRDIMNLRLSQERAEAVLDALGERRGRTELLVPIGYGETEPVADNDTAAGREANRRIEFRLVARTDEARKTGDVAGAPAEGEAGSDGDGSDALPGPGADAGAADPARPDEVVRGRTGDGGQAMSAVSGGEPGVAPDDARETAAPGTVALRTLDPDMLALARRKAAEIRAARAAAARSRPDVE